MKVAIQGELGSFSHEAAGKMLPGAAVVPCARSAEVFDRVESGKVQAAVIPIENSLAGSVAEHFDLLLAREVFIHGEMHLRIRHNLIAPAGVKLGEVKTGFLASRGARPVPQLLSLTPRNSGGAVLRHRWQRAPRHRGETDAMRPASPPSGLPPSMADESYSPTLRTTSRTTRASC